MLLLFSNNGTAFRHAAAIALDPRDLDEEGNPKPGLLTGTPIVAEPGEIAFDHEPTEEELQVAFPGRAAALLQIAKDDAKRAIDVEAERRRLLVLTPGAGQAMVYEQKRREALALQSDPAPNAASYRFLAAEVGITAATMAGVAAVILGLADAWAVYGAAIEQARLAGKRDVDAAVDAGAVNAVLAAVAWPAAPAQ